MASAQAHGLDADKAVNLVFSHLSVYVCLSRQPEQPTAEEQQPAEQAQPAEDGTRLEDMEQ